MELIGDNIGAGTGIDFGPFLHVQGSESIGLFSKLWAPLGYRLSHGT